MQPSATSGAAERALIHVRFAQQAAARPDATAVACGDETLSYAQLNQRANQLAHMLIAAGVKPDQPVGLCLQRSIDLIVGILGILKAGGAYVPLDPSYPADRLAHILDQACPAQIVTNQNSRAALPEFAADLIDIAATGTAADADPQIPVMPEHLCYIIFTSGTTGTPKGVMVSHANVTRLFDVLADDLEFSLTDVWTLFHSFAFGFSAWEIFGALLTGAKLVVVPEHLRTDPAGLYRLLRDEQVTVFSQTPSAFRQLLLKDAFASSDSELNLRCIVFSGEAAVAADIDAWFRAHPDSPRLINTYAITETGGQVAFCEYTQDHVVAGSIGKPLSDTPVFST
jgi:amino acid adenylation domain-containing protein